MKFVKFLIINLFLFTTILFSVYSSPKLGDTIQSPRIIQVPVIDGSGSDKCWDSAIWNPMPYVWIPYGTVLSAADFTGRFKTVWNAEKNLMYFLFEITDDIFVNGYIFSKTKGNYYLYDVVELFIDEDRSGGLHETNNNAFAYHITNGNASVEYDAIDMWNTERVNYRNHFPEFKRVKNGTVYTWEFSMMVLNSSYTPTSVLDNYRPALTVGKKMGFSAAYCDDDHSSANPVRDHFIASKYQTQANSNESYKNASIFGLLQLVAEPTAIPNSVKDLSVFEAKKLDVFPNPVSDLASVSFSSNYIGTVDVSVFNAIGQTISKAKFNKTQQLFKQNLDFSNNASGLYIISITAGTEKLFSKVLR